MSKRLTTVEFIERARRVHGNKYDYSKVVYVDAHTKVCIICPIHGEFWQMPYVHLNGKGCKECGYEKNSQQFTTSFEEFVKKSNLVHNNKYIYNENTYTNLNTKTCIICPIHGEFWQTPHDHLSGHGCASCQGLKKLTTKDFIERARKIHGNKYDYSKVMYINAHTKVCIICPIHGEFWQTPYQHLNGHACPKCQYILLADKFKNDNFVELADEIHKGKYDYSKVVYKNNKTKVCIICPIHGEFWQTPASHLRGQGCPHCRCKYSHLEEKTSTILNNNKIEYIQHCNKSRLEWLGGQHLDFYLPQYNIAIECQGEQHFRPIEYFGGEEYFKYTKALDLKKKRLCEEHNVNLYYINYNDNIETKVQEFLKSQCQNT